MYYWLLRNKSAPWSYLNVRLTKFQTVLR